MKKIYLIAVVIALAAGLATYFFANELKTSKIVTGVDDATVLIALRDIDENTILTADMFQEVKMPVTAVSYGTVSKTNDIIGYMSGVKILKGEQLMAGKLIPVGEENAKGRLSYQLENGKYAYTIEIDARNSMAYFLKEGDRINIYDSVAPSAKPALENILVLKIGDYAANKQQDAGVEITSYGVMTLELDEKQIAKFLDLEKAYRISLVSYVEAYSLADDIAAAGIPEDQPAEPQTNYGMGEITTAPPTTESN
ncbi:MAG: Flp pilus assembly protein CpaB [Clostridia bacterium]|nr:Flp pilus assembly protein CpaB [Clostridia bacterium]